MSPEKNRTNNTYARAWYQIETVIDEFLPALWDSEIMRDLLIILTGKTRLEEIQELMKMSWEETLRGNSKDVNGLLKYCQVLLPALLFTFRSLGIIREENEEVEATVGNELLN